MEPMDQHGQLEKYQTHNLILLVGTNPLPNYVAAQLLCKPGGKVHLLSSTDTIGIAERLRAALKGKPFDVCMPKEVRDLSPSGVYMAVSNLVQHLTDTVGLNYTGGTKAMSVQAYRAVLDKHPNACFTYLDARKLSILVDDPCHLNDKSIEVSLACRMTVPEMAALHGIEVRHFQKQPKLIQVCQWLKADFEKADSRQKSPWKQWTVNNLYRTDNPHKLKSSSDIKALPVPIAEFPDLVAEFNRLAGYETQHLEEWVKPAGFPSDKEGISDFAKWLAGGYWLESIVLAELEAIAQTCNLHDYGMNYVANNSKFEFDVAATRGFQLFALSCTTDASDSVCKQKLFEAYVRARQLGGDEARTALVCYHPEPEQLLDRFKSDNFFDSHSVTVFGKSHLENLRVHLENWINSARG